VKPSQARIKELLIYDPETGIFTWRINRGSRGRAGEITGADDGAGYLSIGVDGKTYRAHVLAWVYVYGEWPDGIDHKDRVRHHNWISNLRKGGDPVNAQNRGLDRRNTSGIKGVRYCNTRKKWTVELALGKKRLFRKRFDTFEEAVQARKSAEMLHGYNQGV
jgi:hypothetical protein